MVQDRSYASKREHGYLFQTDIGLWLPRVSTCLATELRRGILNTQADLCHAKMCFFFTFCADPTVLNFFNEKKTRLSTLQHIETLSIIAYETMSMKMSISKPSGRAPLVDANRPFLPRGGKRKARAFARWQAYV